MTEPDEEKRNEIFHDELEPVYVQNRDMVVQAAYRVTKNRADAEDALQNVFLRVIEHPELQRDLCRNPKAYLYRAATHEAFNIVRTRKRQRLVDDDVSSMEIPTPEPGSERYHDVERVRKALAAMKPDSAELLKLHYIEEHTCGEIAELQGKPLNTVFVELYRARAEFKKIIRRQEKQREIQQKKHEKDADPGVPKTSQE
jgi:RNA polymerase sigma-70 factor (ECF subfamily)